ncbi:ATP-binding protein [Streptomyces sp. XM4193]|uniref:sensor histidine kinase n=1 Tax=Streptomyces sp. XM4193 TaxID=2929782 RepID=UPI001FF8AAC1|nr:ATP-binding protein [Streptomyces sp. XM4193]MCK1797326.1 ATP-binding protein [Streptomyces sp. XM4193]
MGEGRRRGRPAVRLTATEGASRRPLVRLAVAPAAAATAVALLALVYVLATGPGFGAVGADGWLVLALAVLLCAAAVAGAVLQAMATARATVDRYTALRRTTARHQAELQALIQRLEQGERPPRPAHGPLPDAAADDAFALLNREVVAAARSAETAVVDSTVFGQPAAGGSEERVEVFVNLSRRLQSLVHREIELLDELENQVEDPDLLKGLFHVDHLATRIRRHAENLAVLGGAVSRRQWARPVTMTEVLRSAIAEVEHYPRVKLVPPIEGNLRGHAVADVIHLLAELIENASVFSAPQTQVLLRAQHVTAGLAVEVEDRGLGMTAGEQSRMNSLLSDPEHVNVQDLLRDGRIGLFVVSQLARRHGIVVQLQSNIYGGIQAVLILPRTVLGEDPADTGAQPVIMRRDQGAEDAGAQPGPARRPIPAQQTDTATAAHGAGSPPNAPAPQPETAEPPTARGGSDAVDPLDLSVPLNGFAAHPGATATSAEAAAEAAFGGGFTDADHPATSGPVVSAQSAAATDPAAADDRTGTGAPHGAHRYDDALGEPRPYSSEAEHDRPMLPRRRKQEHLVPELREVPPHRDASGEFDFHDPDLMAAFRRGTSLADGTRSTDTLGGRERLLGLDEPSGPVHFAAPPSGSTGPVLGADSGPDEGGRP